MTSAAKVTDETSAYFDRIERVSPHIEIIDAQLWPHKVFDGKGYSYIATEPEFKGYGTYDSGYYTLY